MDHLKEGIGLRGYGQHDPLVEYKRESFDMFEAMMKRFQEETVRYLYLMQVLERPPEGGVGPERWAWRADGTGRTGGWRSCASPPAAGMVGLRGSLQHRSMILRKPSRGRSAASSSRRAWPEAASRKP